MPLASLLPPLLAEAASRHCRLPVLLQGDPGQVLSQALAVVAQRQPQKLYWLGQDAPAGSIALQAGNNYQLLGSECDMLIINACNGINADLIAASAGCLRAGGLWLILAPPDQQWCQQANPAHASLLPYPHAPATHQGQFIRFWLILLAHCPLLKLTLSNNQLQITQQLILPPYHTPTPVAPPYASADQQQAVSAILKVVSGHRKRPLVLVADRGRGKSAALGIAAALLVQQGKQKLIITAASPGAAATAINHYQQQMADNPGLHYMPVDQLLLAQPELDLLFIDEAAALPTAILKQLADRYSRIVFATTEHGYEGTGRGFQLRFQSYLDQTQPCWKRLQLTQPVRYQQHDPLEQLIFRSFLLQQPTTAPLYQPGQPLQLRQYQPNDWLAAPDELLAVFHLLSQAHYQTQVKDLAALLDNPQLSVVALYQNGALLACALLSYEGELEAMLCQHIYQGKRRVQGHLLAQSLAFHLAQPQLASQRLVRIMRIAVALPLQSSGLGSYLLGQIASLLKAQHIDWLGTSFGVNPELLSFWLTAGYTPVRLSHFADNASSEPSILMLKALNANALTAQQLRQKLGSELYNCLTEYPENLSFSVVKELIQPPAASLNQTELELLQLFAIGQRPYQLVVGLLLIWFNKNYLQLDPLTGEVLAARLWQKQNWQHISQRFQLAGKSDCIQLIQKQILKGTDWSCQ
ncbi:tRNA(Met) cytidine acetyltransferase [Arsukibacterium ikkense]|uniref:tRNA(Met) cytidine acetyltransferase TmcA n=1 Tax=Arsukibacterium ikkense TaxID=336831 RepID=A0A0M2UZV1_9GAMM|nr:GNAT family N-acetyltransferase [Arsukibacterium ikkense]KKO43886.1 tRNA(Met) cytidine acetyltransferase [Arsukibacterium ikkense]